MSLLLLLLIIQSYSMKMV